MEIINIEKDLVKKIEELKSDIDAIQQPRSDFALTHFVVGAHDLPGRQRAQAVLELQIKMFNIKRAQLDERRLLAEKYKHKTARDSRDPYDKEIAEIEIERIETDLAELRLARIGSIREAQCLLAILEHLPKYTYEELQAEEAQYWQARLSRQALQDLRTTGTIGQGNIEAIRQYLKNTGDRTAPLSIEELDALTGGTPVSHLTE